METTEDDIDVIEKEEEYLGLEKGQNKFGIAFSGGGIRSASFGLGVMQALVAKGQLTKMHYMSTVSGGGFLGSALTWALKQGEGKAGTDHDNFPLGKRRSGGARLKNKNNQLLDFIRQHGEYLLPTSDLGAISFAAVIVRSILLSLFVYFSLLTILMVLGTYSGFFGDSTTYVIFGKDLPYTYKGFLIPIALGLIGLYLILSLLFSLRTHVPIKIGIFSRYISFIRSQKLVGWLWKGSLVCLLLGTLPYALGYRDKMEVMFAASGSTLFGTIVGIWQYMKAQKSEQSTGAVSDIVIYLGASALIYGLLLLAYITANKYFFDLDGEGDLLWPRFIGLICSTALFGIIVNLNLIGPHRVWRDRLMETYMPNEHAVEENKWEPATKADKALMEDMCDPNNRKPYHIVNTNIILVDSDKTKYKHRGGDNFIISRLYCGSDATGWRTTNTFQKKGGRGMTLATAMATSSAALNPNAGVSGEGLTRNSTISILLSILNLGLGYWTTNPAVTPRPFHPNFFFPGLKSLMRSGLKETRTNIQLSDGGHFENLALYELIRRKLKLIILSDGGADPKFNFDDLANAVEKVRVDFDVKIDFEDEYGLDKILPRTSGKSKFEKKYDIAKHGFAIATITYPDGTDGVLLYIKLAMINDLPTDVYSYKGVHPEFPHQSTADQFFDEKQFEAYRELGYYVAWQAMKKIQDFSETTKLEKSLKPLFES